MRKAAAVVAGIITIGSISILGACGSQQSSSVSTASASSTVSSRARKAMTKEEAGQYYEKVITPNNELQDAFNSAYFVGDVATATDTAAELVKSDKQCAKQLLLRTWPAGTEKYVKGVVKSLNEDATIMTTVSDASSMDEISQQMDNFSDSSSAEALRKKLGLKTPPQFSPVSVTGGRCQPIDSDRYRYCDITIKNDTKGQLFLVTSTISIMDGSGASLDETYPQLSSPLQPGQEVNNEFLISPEDVDKATQFKMTSVTWSAGSNDGTHFELPVDSQTIAIQ